MRKVKSSPNNTAPTKLLTKWPLTNKNLFFLTRPIDKLKRKELPSLTDPPAEANTCHQAESTTLLEAFLRHRAMIKLWSNQLNLLINLEGLSRSVLTAQRPLNSPSESQETSGSTKSPDAEVIFTVCTSCS